MKQTVTFSYKQFSLAKTPLKAVVYIDKIYLVTNHVFHSATKNRRQRQAGLLGKCEEGTVRVKLLLTNCDCEF